MGGSGFLFSVLFAILRLAKIVSIVTPVVYAARTMTGNLGRFAYTTGVLFLG